MSVSLDQRIQDAYAAGFRGNGLVTIVCISLCECGIGSATGCETGCNPDSAGLSCGVLQIYQPAHPGTAVCASNPACCFTLGWQISSHGTNFHPWTTFQNGCWSNHIAVVTAAIAALPPPIGSGACSGVNCGACQHCVSGACVTTCSPVQTCLNGQCQSLPTPPPGSLLVPVLLGGIAAGGGWWLYQSGRLASVWTRGGAPHGPGRAAAGFGAPRPRRARARRGDPYSGVRGFGPE